MINLQDQTFCILCGNLRVFSKRWKDKLDGRGNVITHTESVCPDKECQKKVDQKFTEIRERREASEEKRKGLILAKRLQKTVIPLKLR